MQHCVMLNVTLAKLVSGTKCVQDMWFIMRVIESVGLKVKKPMVLEIRVLVDGHVMKNIRHRLLSELNKKNGSLVDCNSQKICGPFYEESEGSTL